MTQLAKKRSTTTEAIKRPSPTDRKRSRKQDTIDGEVEDFANYVASAAFALASRTADPVKIVQVFAAGVGMITAQFIANPSKSERQGLEDAMTALTVASNGILVAKLMRSNR